MHSAPEPASRRGILETTVVVLMAVVLLGMAFLFWNQALLLERLNHSQDMLKDLHAWVKREQAPAPPQTPASHTPAPFLAPSASSRFPSDLLPAEPLPQPVQLTPAPVISTPAPVTAPVVQAAPAPKAIPPAPEPVRTRPAAIEPAPAREIALAEAPPVLSDPPAPEPRVQIPSENPILPPAPTPQPDPATPATSVTPAATPADPSLAIWQEYGPVITRVISDLYAGHYDQVAARFTPAFSQHMPKTLLSYTMDRDRSRYGNFRKVLGYKLVDEPQLKQEGQTAFRVTVDTDKSQILVFTITLTDQKQINGLFFKALPVQTSSN